MISHRISFRREVRDAMPDGLEPADGAPELLVRGPTPAGGRRAVIDLRALSR